MTKKWFIQFRIWDVVQDKLIRRRVMKKNLAAIRDKDQRIAAGEEWAKIITDDLKYGGYSERKPIKRRKY